VALTHRKPQTYMLFISAGLLVIVLASLLFLSINRSQVILQQWNDLSADFIKLGKAGNAVDDSARFSRLANYDLIALRIVDNTLMASTATQMLEPSDADHQSYQFIETPRSGSLSVYSPKYRLFTIRRAAKPVKMPMAEQSLAQHALTWHPLI
jgi:hypothetical protein